MKIFGKALPIPPAARIVQSLYQIITSYSEERSGQTAHESLSRHMQNATSYISKGAATGWLAAPLRV
jgi:hypothetical protein